MKTPLLLACAAATFVAAAEKPYGFAQIPRERGLYRCQVHRGGGAKSRPDNALESFVWCWNLGFTPEMDARMTKDRVLIAMHDENLCRIGRGITPELASRKIWDLKWNEIREIDTGSYLGPQYAATRLATAESVFAAMQGRPERLLYVDGGGIDCAQLPRAPKLPEAEIRLWQSSLLVRRTCNVILTQLAKQAKGVK